MAANRKLLAAAAVCAVAVIGVTGCSSDSGDKDPFEGMSADKIAKKASTASRGAGSFTMLSRTTQDGQEITGEFSVLESGDCKATIESPKTGHSELLTIGETSYIKGDEAFWKATGPGVADRVKGRWVKSPAKGKSACDLGGRKMFEGKKLKGLERGDDAEVDGQKTAVLVKKKGDETTTFYVALEGKPYFLKVTNDGDSKGTATFRDFDKPIDVKAPPSGEVVDEKELAGR
ncbi:lipoprotein [Streptomyces longispororuber]|uniref:Lipoprotein n=1 Tax=Streptomyces longispororuber TaxID=68230 RepID=A0A919A0N3_9ACTN|nr:hypothetical protein [Streptomyces longispororuber]GHE79457.1 lipoprotein [Streptomyces longispororuber]